MHHLLNSGTTIKTNMELLNENMEKQTQKAHNEELVKQAYMESKLEAAGINVEEQEHQKVLNNMAEEEQPKLQVPVEDMQNLLRVVETQRNNALTRLAVEQARIKSLLFKTEEQQKTITSQGETIKTLTETIKNMGNNE